MLIMGATTLSALALCAAAAHTTMDWVKIIPATSEGVKASWQWIGPMNEWGFLIGIVIVTFVGIAIAMLSDQPVFSLIGYAMVAGPMGMLMGPTVGMFTGVSVVKVIFITAGVTCICTVIGAIAGNLESWGIWLFGGLTLLLFGSFGIPLAGWLIPGFPIKDALAFSDWIGIVLFSFYIIFDMNKAKYVPATVDNAIDCSLALFMDIINLFIRTLLRAAEEKTS